MDFLVPLLIALVVVAVIGHGIWVLVAAILRAAFGKADPQPVSAAPRCVGCGANLQSTDDFCAACGRWQKKPSDAGPLAELAITARQLDHFLNQGKIDPETHRRVMAAVEEERERLTAPTRPQPAPATVVEIPPPVSPSVAVPKPVEQPVFVRTAQPAVTERAEVSPAFNTAQDLNHSVSRSDSQVEAAFHPAPSAQPQPVVQPEPRRSLAEMLETFMEESSIRWGELVGGLLIIGCSLALVISLWSQIKGQPLLKFSVFVGMTAGLFGMGFYSAHRWKLPTTSRTALIISTLLVPLNFLAMASFARGATPNSPLVIGGELLALGLFLFLVYHAGGTIAPGNAWLLTGATLAPSFAMLMAKHLHETHVARAETLWLCLAPIISYWLSTGVMLRGVKGDDESPGEADRIFTLFGVASFASLLPVGLLLAKSAGLAKLLQTISPLIVLTGVPAIAAGLTLRQSKAKLSGHAQTAATAIGLIGAMLLPAGLGLAWPQTYAMIGVALVNCAVCAAIAWRFNLKPAHPATLAFFALAYLIGANLLAGSFPSWSEDGARLASAFVSRTSGLAWLSLFVLFGAAAEIWRRFGYKTESRLYEFAALCSAFFSLSLLTWRGWGRAGDPQHLAWVYVFYAAAAFAVAWYRNQPVASWIGTGLSLLTVVQALVYEFGYALAPHHPVRLSLLIYASFATVIAVALSQAGEKAQRIFVRPLTFAALISSVAVAPFLPAGGWMSVGQVASRLLWLAGIWLVLAVMNAWPVLFTAFQAALSLGVVFGVAAIFDRRALPSHSSWSDPHLLQAEGIALALLSLAWLLLRIVSRRIALRPNGPHAGMSPEVRASNFIRLLDPPWPAVDRVLTAIVWLLLIALCMGTLGDILVRTPGSRARGIGPWLLLLSLLLVFVVSLWERFRKRAVLALMTLPACACLLAAALTDTDTALKSLYWWWAACFALVAIPIFFREQVWRVVEGFGWPQMEAHTKGLASLSRAASLALFAIPALLLTSLFWPVAPAADGARLLDGAVSFAPLIVISFALAAHAIRERSSIYAFACGLMLNLAVRLGGSLIGFDLATTIQASLITSAAFALLWLEASRRLAVRVPEEGERRSRPSLLLRSQINVTMLAALSLVAVADGRLLVDPWRNSQMAAAMGGVWGWLTVLLPAAAFAHWREWKFERLRVDLLGVAALAVSSLAACTVSLAATGWAAYHALMTGVAISAWLMLALRWKRVIIFNRFRLEGRDTSLEWATGLAFAQLLITLPTWNDVWWTAGSLAALCFLFTGLAIVTRHRGYVYLSGALCNVVVTRLILWADIDRLLLVNVISLCLSSLVWLKLDLAVMRAGGASKIVPFHRIAARVAMVVIAIAAAARWLEDLNGETYLTLLDWAALGSLTALLVGCLWDEETDLSWRGLQAVGLIAICQALAPLHLSKYALLATTAAAWSLYALAAALLWRNRQALVRFADGLRIPRRAGVSERMWLWLTKGSALIAAFVALSCILTIFGADLLKLRLLVTTTAFALPLAFALLTRGRRPWIAVGIRLLLLDLVLWSWAWLHPSVSLQLINRLVVVMLISAAILIAYRLVVANQLSRESEWRKGLRDDLWWISVIGLASLAAILGVEVTNYAVFGAALTSWPVVLAVLLTLVGLCLSGLAFALLPGEDPFGLDERGRMRYVYAAEGFFVLTLLQVRITMPWLFGGTFTKYWPLLVMAIAFAGVALSEAFRRQGRLVLSEPLERTGVLLPLLPVVGFWAFEAQVSYSILLLVVGLFYGWLSVMRHSFGFGLLAALAGNGGLWHFLHGEAGYTFSEHPQLWLIPVALSVLLAAHLNRDSLSSEQMSSIRYGALMTIYVSSTADIFLNGVNDAPWLPIILAVLSVSGVIAGILLRIRSFLFLGTGFLLLSLLTMIWSASVNLHWAWLWPVMGIALGVFILYAFAMFERKREEMLTLVARLKQWQ